MSYDIEKLIDILTIFSKNHQDLTKLRITKLSYYIDDASNELTIFILVVLLLIRADLGRFGFDLWYMWECRSGRTGWT